MIILNAYLSGVDPDAAIFFAATGIVDTTQKSATNRLFTDFKDAAIYSKIIAGYPMVGGTATTCKYNLKDPRDLDAAFRLTFFNSPTFSSNGVDWNGSTQYADTHCSPSLMNQNSLHISYYSRQNVSETAVDMGCAGGGSQVQIQLYNGSLYTDNNDNSSQLASGGVNSAAFFINSRTGSAGWSAYRNAINVGNKTYTAVAGSSYNIYIGAYNNGGSTTNYSSKECAFASIGDGLTSTEVSAFYTAVQTFNTTLGRQV